MKIFDNSINLAFIMLSVQFLVFMFQMSFQMLFIAIFLFTVSKITFKVTMFTFNMFGQTIFTMIFLLTILVFALINLILFGLRFSIGFLLITNYIGQYNWLSYKFRILKIFQALCCIFLRIAGFYFLQNLWLSYIYLVFSLFECFLAFQFLLLFFCTFKLINIITFFICI